jgi:hypothetical protein
MLVLIALLAAAPAASAQLVISEYRLRGAGQSPAHNEYVEILNPGTTAHTVSGGGNGYAIVASDGIARCTIPNGTVIPPRGHWLCVNAVGYGLASYPAGNGTTATADASFSTDIPDGSGIALFNNNTGAYTLQTRIDAVGSTAVANSLYREGTGHAAITAFSIDYAFHRDACGKGGSITTMAPSTATTPRDTNNNAADFVFVDTNGTSAGACFERVSSTGIIRGRTFDDCP